MTIKKNLNFLKNNTSSLLIIHYSCQNLNDNNEGYSPRITSIAVYHVESSAMHSFSIHLVAEIMGISREEIASKYNVLESQMLRDFNNYVKDHQDYYWLHWNMTNISFGFETLFHRFRVLTQETPPLVNDSKKINLSSLVSDIYGKNYVEHPRMNKLMDLNGGVPRDFLSGAEEVKAFDNMEYLKLHKSTMSKVYFFKSAFFKLTNKKLKTSKSGIRIKFHKFIESSVIKGLGIVALVLTITQGVYFIKNQFFPIDTNIEIKINNEDTVVNKKT
jgi:hypothetical protein